jgi:hypothetical protein
VTPNALLAKAVEAQIVGPLEAAGFRYGGRLLTLTRRRGDFTDEISFSVSDRGGKDDCQFTTAWMVASSEFAQWHQKHWSTVRVERFVVITNDWLIRGWPRRSGFRLLNEIPRDGEETRELLEAMKTVGIPFLDSIRTLEAAAEFWLDRDMRTDLCCALLVKTGQVERAQRLLENTIFEVERQNLPSSRYVVPQLMELKERYLG